MPKIECHRIRQKCKTYIIKPKDDKYEYSIVYYLEACEVCNQKVLKVQHVDFYSVKTELKAVKQKYIDNFINTMKIIEKEKDPKIANGTNKPEYYYWAVEGNKQVEKTLDDYKTGRELCTLQTVYKLKETA